MSAAITPNDALVAAIEAKSLDAMRTALRAGADANETVLRRLRGFHEPFPRTMADLVREVAVRRPDGAGQPWHLAALRLLHEFGGLQPGVDLNEAMVKASEWDCGPAVVRFLLDCGADPNHVYFVCTALSSCSCEETARVLIAAGARVDAHAMTGVAGAFDGRVLKVLLDAGGDVNAMHKDCTPLLSAASVTDNFIHDSVELEGIRMLLDAGADPTAVTRRGQTALDVLRGAVTADSDLRGAAGQRLWLEGLRLLQRAEAWWRRRHLLLAIRGRYQTAAAVTEHFS